MRFGKRLGFGLLVSVLAPALLTGQRAPRHFDLYAHFNTSMGEIVAELFPDRAPVTVANFVALAQGTKTTYDKNGKLVQRPFYNGLTFYRVIQGFMIQTGQVKEGLPCGIPNIHDEIDPARTFAAGAGALAMANAGRPNTGQCQIFITVAPQKGLDGKYTIFGQVVSGQDVAEAISEVPVNKERPVTPVIIKSVTIERRAR